MNLGKVGQVLTVKEIFDAMPASFDKSKAQGLNALFQFDITGTNAASIAINQDTDLFLGKLKTGDSARHPIAAGRHAWLQLIQGELDANGARLTPGDAVAISEVDSLTLSAIKPSDFLLFDLN